MGLLSKYRDFQDNRKHKRIEKAKKLVINAKAIREDRMAALSFLAEAVEDCQAAVQALLPRFNYSLEHGINDSREKELAFKGIVRFGGDALPLVVDWLKQTTRIAWPIKVVKEVGDDKTVVECLKSVLNFNDVSFDQAAVDKNYDILCYLRDYPLQGFYKDIAHFLNDVDERVRFAAAEALIAQKDADVRTHLEPFFQDLSSENRRLRSAVIQLYVEQGWAVLDRSPFEQGLVGDDIRLDNEGHLQRL